MVRIRTCTISSRQYIENIKNIEQNLPNYSFDINTNGMNCDYIIKLLNDAGVLNDKLFNFDKLLFYLNKRNCGRIIRLC